MATSTVNISGTKSGMTSGSAAIGPASFVNASAPDSITTQAFVAATFAAVSVPAGTTGVWVVPPASNAGAITLKGVTGDTGVLLHLTQASFFSLASGATFGILCANNTTIEFFWT